MLILPIGWGMAVTSFRMFKLEWVLSRSIIYMITFGLIIYLMIIGLVIGMRYFDQKDTTALIALIIVGLAAISLMFSSLVSFVGRAVDRIYYRDWYNYQAALRNLSEQLADARDETCIMQLLTVKLPEILKVEKCSLLQVSEDGNITTSSQSAFVDDVTLCEIIAGMRNLSQIPVGSSQSGSTFSFIGCRGEFQLWLRLTYTDRLEGLLLIGHKLSRAPFSVRDYALLNTLAHHAGTALSNIRLTSRLIDNEKRALAADMAGGIAHEIGNALAPLLGQTQLLDRRLKTEQEKHLIESLDKPVGIIIEMCSRIKRIVANLNRLAEPPRLQLEPVSLSKIAEDTIQLLAETAGRIKYFVTDEPHAKYVLVKQLSQDLPLIKGDRQQLSQVFMNLIINAADAIEAMDGGTLTVGTCLSGDGAAVVGFVSDTGKGIEEEIVKRIFQPYFTTKEKGEGTGMGLAVVRSIIEAHSGQIIFHPVEPHGTRFEFTIPVPEDK